MKIHKYPIKGLFTEVEMAKNCERINSVVS